MVLGKRFTRTFPIAQLTAEARVSVNPTTVMLPPKDRPMINSPMRAASIPTACWVLGLSPIANAARTTVKSACVCTTTAVIPAGMPFAMPKNWSRNWPVKTVNPMAMTTLQRIRGRGSQIAATAATMNLSAVNCGGCKALKADLAHHEGDPPDDRDERCKPHVVGFHRSDRTGVCPMHGHGEFLRSSMAANQQTARPTLNLSGQRARSLRSCGSLRASLAVATDKLGAMWQISTPPTALNFGLEQHDPIGLCVCMRFFLATKRHD